MTASCTGAVDTGFASLDYLQIGFLGVVQGVTELLPVSSTAHMRVIPALLGWPDPGSAAEGRAQAGGGYVQRIVDQAAHMARREQQHAAHIDHAAHCHEDRQGQDSAQMG